MKRLELKKILLILIGVVTITSCQKENLLDEQKTLSTVKQQKFMEGILEEGVIPEEEYILYYIFEEGGFNVDNYASPIVFREHVEIDGVSYDIFITDDEAIMQNWKEEMLAQGKLVFVKFVNGVYIVVVKDIPDEEFIIMTEAERQYIIDNCPSIPVEEFEDKDRAREYFELTTPPGVILVATVKDDRVYFLGITAEYNHKSWYNRLESHFNSGHVIGPVTEPIDPTIDPDDKPVSCIYTSDWEVLYMYIWYAIYNKRDYIVERVYITNPPYWYFCDGTCKNENCQE